MLDVATALAITEGVALTGRSLSEVEREIEHGWTAAASGYREIREDRLYQQAEERYDDFDAYCLDRWNLRRDAVDKMIQAFTVVEALHKSFMELVPPANEGQARALAPLLGRPEEMAAALEEARAEAKGKNAKLTAQRIGAAVKRRLPSDPERDGVETGREQMATAVAEAPTEAVDGEDGEPPEPAEAAQFWAARNALWSLKAAAQEQSNRFGGECYPEDLKRSQLDDLTKRVADAIAALAAVDRVLNAVKEAKQRPDWKPPKPSTRRASEPRVREVSIEQPTEGLRQHILNSVPAGARLTTAELATATGLTRKAVSRRLPELVREGLLLCFGDAKPYEYALPAQDS